MKLTILCPGTAVGNCGQIRPNSISKVAPSSSVKLNQENCVRIYGTIYWTIATCNANKMRFFFSRRKLCVFDVATQFACGNGAYSTRRRNLHAATLCFRCGDEIWMRQRCVFKISIFSLISRPAPRWRYMDRRFKILTYYHF